MLHKTRGIVLKTTDYGEASVIVQLLTEKFGMQSYIINGVKKPKAKISRNMLQPLHLLDLIVYHKGTGSIQRIRELKNAPLLHRIPYDVVKSSIALFLNEVLYKAIKQQTPDEQMFGYIFGSVELLDNLNEGIANFHLLFLLGLTRFLGFYPHNNDSDGAHYFDLHNGVFSRLKPESNFYMSPPHTGHFSQLLNRSFEDLPNIKLSNDERRYLLTRLLEYYALHVDGFGNIRSHDILEEVLS
ncbi:DNA repair protein RecO [Mucilaginibacter terrae]|uniref:DNA repair protein RecO n=1 Tax=Mucilaginibacter terrae TaxID=1955052 RepID=A0ABU3GVU1_9SPHI|nr:DNA repair protein RecO [Mucilaginibacter terrae]MDT3403893.1 DNA repair protein RecO (recombination protein O) [Mucilaginibacter terrae]